MTGHLDFTPLRYHPDVEHVEPDEPQTARDLAETMLSIAQKTYADSGHAIRCVHAKSHGLLAARIQTLPDLPPELAQGIFAKPLTYEAVVRLSTTPGDLLHDSVSTPRGMALKVLDVQGARLPDSEESTSQDFVMVNGRTFNSPSGKAFLRSLKMLAMTTDRLEGTKEVVSKVFKGLESVIETVGGESATLKSLGGNPKPTFSVTVSSRSYRCVMATTSRSWPSFPRRTISGRSAELGLIPAPIPTLSATRYSASLPGKRLSGICRRSCAPILTTCRSKASTLGTKTRALSSPSPTLSPNRNRPGTKTACKRLMTG